MKASEGEVARCFLFVFAFSLIAGGATEIVLLFVMPLK
jgi:hypothetical protein